MQFMLKRIHIRFFKDYIMCIITQMFYYAFTSQVCGFHIIATLVLNCEDFNILRDAINDIGKQNIAKII